VHAKYAKSKISCTVKKILQKASKYCATFYGMIANDLPKNSKISLQKKQLILIMQNYKSMA